MRSALALCLAIPAIALGGCAAGQQDDNDPAAKAPPVKVVGEPQSCIPRSRVR